MKSYYCTVCEQWFRARAQRDIEHWHSGIAPAFMRCEPLELKSGGAYIGIREVYPGTKAARWRAILIYIETGYSETPSWGHEPGGWVHYAYEVMKAPDGECVEAETRAKLIAKLGLVPGIEPDAYFKPLHLPDIIRRRT